MNDTTAVARDNPATEGATPALMPPVDVIENNAGIIMIADMPGVSRENLNLQVESDTLTIEGSVQLAMPEAMEASHAEVAVPRYRRVFTLSKELDSARISAELRSGVLTLRIPKAEHAQPRMITVSVA